MGTGFGSDQALAHSRDREQTAAGRLVRKVAVSLLPARLLLAQTVPAGFSKLRLPPRPALLGPALPAADVKAPAAAAWSRGQARHHSNSLTHHLGSIRTGPRRDHASSSREAPGQAYIWHVKPQATPCPPRRLAWSENQLFL